jgi:hypothetical protein
MGTGAAIGAGEKRHRRDRYSSVMPGLVPGIHALLCCVTKDVDGRDKPGHDARRQFANLFFAVPVRLPWIERTQAMFHGKCFTPNKLDFRDLENCLNQLVDRA